LLSSALLRIDALDSHLPTIDRDGVYKRYTERTPLALRFWLFPWLLYAQGRPREPVAVLFPESARIPVLLVLSVLSRVRLTNTRDGDE
jgi:hypothetical protein